MERKKTGEARQTQKLLEMGFTQIDKEISLQVRASLPHKMSRNQRRQLKRQKYRPWFTTSSAITFATDETGQSWKGPPNTDLSFLGYDNRTSDAQADLSKFRNTSARYN